MQLLLKPSDSRGTIPTRTYLLTKLLIPCLQFQVHDLGRLLKIWRSHVKWWPTRKGCNRLIVKPLSCPQAGLISRETDGRQRAPPALQWADHGWQKHQRWQVPNVKLICWTRYWRGYPWKPINELFEYSGSLFFRSVPCYKFLRYLTTKS